MVMLDTGYTSTTVDMITRWIHATFKQAFEFTKVFDDKYHSYYTSTLIF
jgi:hypothetical protein